MIISIIVISLMFETKATIIATAVYFLCILESMLINEVFCGLVMVRKQ